MEHQYVAFNLGHETYGINIMCVSEIIRIQSVTRIPKNPDFVEGVINLRGKIIPVIDLKKQFDLGEIKHDNDTRIVVVQLSNETVGLVVEEVTAVLSLLDEEIDSALVIQSKVNTEFIQGIGHWKDNLIILLEVEKILKDQELKQLAKMDLEKIKDEVAE